MKKFSLFLCFASILLFCSTPVFALPVAIGGPASGPGDGLNSRWVDTSFAPSSLSSAIAALALGPSDPGYVGEVNQVAPYIDYADSGQVGYVAGFLADPLTPDNSFAVEYSGYINIAVTSTYTFRAYTDDGFRLSIGGEMISQYTANRAPGTTDGTISLAAGVYEFSFVGWEWTGGFVNELTWHDLSTSTFSLVDSKELFTYNPVPEPATMLLLGSGLVGLAGFRRKNKK